MRAALLYINEEMVTIIIAAIRPTLVYAAVVSHPLLEKKIIMRTLRRC